jgi:MFS family permease
MTCADPDTGGSLASDPGPATGAGPPPPARGVPGRTDARLILGARALRAFAYGLLSVVLALTLLREGFSTVAIGGIITVSLVGDFCGTYVIGLFADSWGRRRTLVILALLMAATGAVFGLTDVYPLLLLAGFFGTLGTSASETAPFLPIEQAMLAQTGAADQRTRVFARYNLVASFAAAAGALAAGLPDALARVGLGRNLGLHLVFAIYVAAALVVAWLARRLSAQVEAPASARRVGASRWQRVLPPLGTSRGIVLRLAALFSVDAFAGGLTVQSLLVLFLHLRFGVSLGLLAALFFAANTLSALSFLAAAPLARRIGLLNTMVFTHLPSNALLALVALMPTFPLAALILLARQALSQLDVPTRQAYTMALVAPEARTAAASTTSLARSAGSAASPVVAGALLQGPLLALGLPLLIAGAIKSIYDLTLWATFRRVPPLPGGEPTRDEVDAPDQLAHK